MNRRKGEIFTGKNILRGAVTTVVMSAGVVSAQADQIFNIDKQPLKTAVAVFAEQAKVNLVAQREVNTSVLVAAVNGEINAGIALRTMLNGTDLEVRESGDGMFVIARRQIEESGGLVRDGLRNTHWVKSSTRNKPDSIKLEPLERAVVRV